MTHSLRNAHVSRRHRPIDPDRGESASGLLRVLVLDGDSEIVGQLENALWIWPHKIARTSHVDEAVRLCQHLTPTAVLVAADRSDTHEAGSIPALRRRLPAVPIIAVVSQQQFESPGQFLDQGANALLRRDDAQRSTLHDLLMSVQRVPASPSARAQTPTLALPWRESNIVGALICDVSGSIVDCNRSLSNWLGYDDPEELVGKNVLRQLLTNREDWTSWIQVAGDTQGIMQQQTDVAAKNGQILWMRIEVFAAPNHPSYLQAMFSDETEKAILAAPTCATEEA